MRLIIILCSASYDHAETMQSSFIWTVVKKKEKKLQGIKKLDNVQTEALFYKLVCDYAIVLVLNMADFF